MSSRRVHISIDDVTISLQRLSNRNNISIYEDKLFRYLRALHRLCGLKITLYVFAKYGDWSIMEMPDRYKGEFEDANDWMKFGFHAISDEQKQDNVLANFSNQYQSTIQQIYRFAGEQSIAKILRLHYWFYPKEYTKVLKENDVINVLVKADYDDEDIDGVPAWRTQIRIEQDQHIVRKICELNDTKQPVVVFSHEWALNRKNKVKLALVVFVLKLRGYKFICE